MLSLKKCMFRLIESGWSSRLIVAAQIANISAWNTVEWSDSRIFPHLGSNGS